MQSQGCTIEVLDDDAELLFVEFILNNVPVDERGDVVSEMREIQARVVRAGAPPATAGPE